MDAQSVSAARPPADAPAIEAWLVDYIGSVIDVPKEGFPVDDTFDTYGLDSVELTIMAGMIEERFALTVEAGELVENPSVASLARHLAGRLSPTA
jgi:acyl carrier protein